MVGGRLGVITWQYRYDLYTTAIIQHGRVKRGPFNMAIWLLIIHHGNYTPWSGKVSSSNRGNIAIIYTPGQLYTMVG